jgi:hypothetical protein
MERVGDIEGVSSTTDTAEGRTGPSCTLPEQSTRSITHGITCPDTCNRHWGLPCDGCECPEHGKDS